MRSFKMKVSAILLAFSMCISMPVPEVSASYNAEPGVTESVSDNSVEEVEAVSDNSVEEAEAAEEAEAVEEIEAVETAGDSDVSAAWGGDLMGLTEAKRIAESAIAPWVTLPEVIVAVIDTGINTTHEVFTDRLTGDVSGTDDNGHGSAVAGIIAKNTPANVKILALKALDEDKRGLVDSLEANIKKAVNSGAEIINISLGVSRTDTEEDEYELYKGRLGEAIGEAAKAGCLVVVSAGNNGEDIALRGELPACLDNVITVSAVNEGKELCGFSNYGEAVDFCAPGEKIYCPTTGGSASYEYVSGTSMAAAFISSALAYLKMYNSDLSADALIERLEDHAEDIGDEGEDLKFGKGLPVFRDGRVSGDEDAVESEEMYVKPVIKKASFVGTGIYLTVELPAGEVFDVLRKEEWENSFVLAAEKQIATGESTEVHDMNVEPGKTYHYCIKANRNIDSEKNYSDPFEKTAAFAAEFSIRRDFDVYYPSSPKYDRLASSSVVYLNKGEQVQLFTSYSTGADMNGEVEWSSSNELVVRVDENGVLTGISEGEADVTATLIDEGLTASMHVISSSIDCKNGGKCGDGLIWSFAMDTLYIKGSGSMYQSRRYPWERYGIKKIVIGDGVENLPDPVSTDVQEGVFSNLGGLTTVEFGSGLKSIGAYAFCGCTALKEINFPKNLKVIKDSAFRNCSDLQSVVFPDTLTDVGSSAFAGCGSLKVFRLPDSVERIGSYVITEEMEEIRIPGGITSASPIWSGNVEKLILSKNVREYKELYSEYYRPVWDDLLGGVSVSNYIVEEGNPYLSSIDGVLFNYDQTELIKYPRYREGSYRIPESVVSIADSAFESCINLTELTVNNSLKKIGDRAFHNCQNLSNVRLPDSVEEIGWDAFSLCSQFTEFTYPPSVEICNRCLYGTSVTKVTLPPAVKIMNSTFQQCRKLEEINIPEGLEKMTGGVFSNCWKLKEIVLPASLKDIDTSYTHTDGGLFMENCKSIEKFVIPDCLTALTMEVFYSCSSLKSIRIHKGMKSISKGVFFGTPLEEIIYEAFTKDWNQIENHSEAAPGAALYIDASGSFGNGFTWHAEGRSGDLTLTISGEGEMPDFASLKELPWHNGLPEIRHVVIEDGITHVGKLAFYSAEVLEDVTIGRGVDFGENAFRRCENLDTFLFKSGEADNYQVEVQYLLSEFTGKETKPGVYVTKGDHELREGIDYTVGYENNRVPGQASIVISFTGDDAAKKDVRIPFIIAAKVFEGDNIKALSKILLSSSTYIYNGKEQTPLVTVESGRWTLREGVDYYLTLSPGRINKGTYSVTAKGAGAYKGAEISELYEIQARDIADLEASVSPASFVYDGNEKTPALTVAGLVNGTDYSVTYSNNVEPGNAAAVASGIGNYTGTLARTFTIKEEAEEPELLTANEGRVDLKKDNKEDSFGKNDSVGSVPESAAGSEENPVQADETEIRTTEGSPERNGNAVLTAGTEENSENSSLKGAAAALVLTAAAAAAYCMIVLMKRRKDQEEEM